MVHDMDPHKSGDRTKITRMKKGRGVVMDSNTIVNIGVQRFDRIREQGVRPLCRHSLTRRYCSSKHTFSVRIDRFSITIHKVKCLH